MNKPNHASNPYHKLHGFVFKIDNINIVFNDENKGSDIMIDITNKANIIQTATLKLLAFDRANVYLDDLVSGYNDSIILTCPYFKKLINVMM